MKAQRNLLNEYIDDDASEYTDYDYNDDYDDNTPFDNSETRFQPKRSVTLGDFFSPGLLVRSNDDEEVDDPGNENVGEYGDDEEEENDDDILEECFQELEKKYDISGCDEDEIIAGLRDVNYDLKRFVELALDGEFGPFKKLNKNKGKVCTQKNGGNNGNNSNNKQQQQKKADLSRLPPRSVSHFSLAVPPKQHKDCMRTPESVIASLATQKKRINVVVVGHVDAGKSTLMGYLLYLTKNVSEAEFGNLFKNGKRVDDGQVNYSWVLDEDEVERERGVTIDVAMREFETKNLNVTILDAPGHKDFVPNMIAGASQADAALLVVDSSNPLIEKGQAKEHLLLCRALGVSSLIVVINKMDYIDYDEPGFKDVVDRLSKILKSIGWKALYFIPTSASFGYNIVKKSPEHFPWYNGPTIIEAIDNLSKNLPQYDISGTFVLCVSESNENVNSLSVFGKVESGFVCVGDNVRVFPVDTIVKVSKVKINGKAVQYATPGSIVELSLQTRLLSDVISVGSVITSPDNIIPNSTKFEARIVTFQMNVPLLRGANLIFHRHTIDLPLQIDNIICLIDKKTKLPEKKKASFIPSNSMADVQFHVNKLIPISTQGNCKSLSRFIIRAGGETLGFGSITKVITSPSK